MSCLSRVATRVDCQQVFLRRLEAPGETTGEAERVCVLFSGRPNTHTHRNIV